MSLALALLASPASAFAPTDAWYDDVDPQRIRYQNPDEQGRLLASDAWQEFVAGDGAGWEARFDEATGTPRYLWGRGIPMPSDKDAMLASLTAWLDRHAVLLGYEAGSLRVRSANYTDDNDTWYVDLDPLRSGLPTYRGGISARIERGNLVFLQVGTAPKAEVTGGIVISERDAIRLAITLGPAPDADHQNLSAEPMLLEQQTLAGHVLRAVWVVRTTTDDPPGRWVSFVDGQTGELVAVHNEVAFASGTVKTKHHERTVDGTPLVTDPVPYIKVASDGSSDTTDLSGDYTVSGNGPYVSSLTGSYVTVKNKSTSASVSQSSSSDPDIVWTSSDATQAEIDTYTFVTQVRQWGLVYGPNNGWVSKTMTAVVNENQTCNAFFDGQKLNFFVSGGGCNNTGEIADVVYHEWGHGFHQFQVQSGSVDGSLGEGAADTVAFLQTRDSRIGPYFFTNGGPVRNVNGNKRYPQDYNKSCYGGYCDPHANGEIFGESMWDLLGELTDEYGADQAVQIESVIHAGLLRGGPDIPGSAYEALVADDDNGNLADGTPHVCEIVDSFGQHGLGTNANVGGVLTSHNPVSKAQPDKPIQIGIGLVSVSAGCKKVGARNAQIHYRIDGKGDWKTASMNSSGTTVQGAIPGQAEGSFVEYYMTGSTTDGASFKNPSGGDINPYTFYVGNTIEVQCDDFDGNGGDYKVVSGDWQHGTPLGLAGDPSGAFSGTKVWGIDLDSDGEYSKNSTSDLASPKIDTLWYTGVFLQYRRWLRVEDSHYDKASISVNGEKIWSNGGDPSGKADTLDGIWMNHAVDLQGKADQGTAKIDFKLVADGGKQYGGWTIDDVCLLAPATTDNKMGIVDFTATAAGDTTVHLAWTNPVHKPLEKVRVVRRADRYPAGADDGDVAEELDSPSVGDAVEVDDVNGHGGTTFYAVYGYDGTGWLSWTKEGWNADKVQLVGGDVPESDQFDTGSYGQMSGCGCSDSGTPALPTLALGLLGLVIRRRR